MEAYLLEWANLLLRWLHVIVAIAYIGSSFYFVWLDNSLRPPADEALRAKGVAGELWAVHAGAFYNPQKYALAPPHLPRDLHWFYWEAYSTWLSGFALFSVLYLFNPKVFLIDPNVADITPTVAVLAALGFLAAGWLVYDMLCRVLEKQEKLLAVLVALYLGAVAWGACHLFSGRAAFLITGAVMATIIAANVFFIIIPNQRKMVAAMKAGEAVDPILSKRSKHRSMHNSYVTLPVIFGMISNHYSLTYSHKDNWLVLVAIMAAGALIRHYYIQRHKHKGNLAYPAAALAILAAVIVWIAPAPPAASATGSAAVDIAQVQKIMEARCIQCHAAKPSLMPIPAKGILLDSPEAVRSHAQAIYQQVVVSKAMPLGNMTKITDEERAAIATWFQAGAK
ncbi:MAG: urate hydroxylase PuuD [Noviherbaspirillum sp.]